MIFDRQWWQQRWQRQEVELAAMLNHTLDRRDRPGAELVIAQMVRELGMERAISLVEETCAPRLRRARRWTEPKVPLAVVAEGGTARPRHHLLISDRYSYRAMVSPAAPCQGLVIQRLAGCSPAEQGGCSPAEQVRRSVLVCGSLHLSMEARSAFSLQPSHLSLPAGAKHHTPACYPAVVAVRERQIA